MPRLSEWPAAWNGSTITGTFVDPSGRPLAGRVRFRMTRRRVRTDSGLATPQATWVATLDASGAFSITLPSTDDLDVNGIPFTYEVTEDLVGVDVRSYEISALTDTTFDLRTVAPAVGSVANRIVRPLKVKDPNLKVSELPDVTAPVALSVTGAVVVDLSASQRQVLTLTGNVSAFSFANPPAHRPDVHVELVQDGTGSRTLAGAAASIKWAGGTAPTLSTAAGRRDIFRFRCDAGGNYYEISRSMNVQA